MTTCLLHIHALRPLHIGSGRADGVIDLPHAREKSTGYPNAPGSGLKGVIRYECETDPTKAGLVSILFGPKRDDPQVGSNGTGVQSGDQGSLMFSDGLLLCLPVRSLAGGFAWVSSPFSLARYLAERQAMGLPGIVKASTLATLTLPVEKCVASGAALGHTPGADVFLQDLKLCCLPANAAMATNIATDIAEQTFPATMEQAEREAWRALFIDRFLIVSEAVFGYLCAMAMEVRPRNRLKDESKVVVKGGLWNEENLPAESILWATVAADPHVLKTTGARIIPAMTDPQQAIQKFIDLSCAPLARTQIGGKATVGRGIVRVLVTPSRENQGAGNG